MSDQPGTKTLPPARTSKSHLENIKKVAVTMQGQQALFLELDQKRPLAGIIQDICTQWKLSDQENFALQFSEQNRHSYITDQNRNEISNGNVLTLTSSPGKKAQNIYSQLNDNASQQDKISALRDLSIFSSDISFAIEFINRNGLPLVIKFVTSGNFNGDPLAYTLKSFVSLMDHAIVSWDVLESDFIRKVAECVNCSSTATLDKQCLQSALEILESVVLHSTGKQAVVEQVVTPVNIIPHLQSRYTTQDSVIGRTQENVLGRRGSTAVTTQTFSSQAYPEVQKNAIALINALFMKADPDKRRKIADQLHSKSMRNMILSHVIRGMQQVGTEMAHQLYVLQVLLLNLHEDRKKTPANSHDQTVLRDIEELRRIAFDVDGDPNINTVRKSPSSAKDYRKLGFLNQGTPVEDFTKTPPGLLALDVMLYFARNHGENYVKVVLENSSRADEHDCPFVRASIMLTEILCDILKIGEQPTEEGQTFYPMFFCHDKPFEEFYCVCIQLLNKTWREMKATSDDFQKVLGVVKEQITRALEIHPSNFDSLRTRLNQLTYSEIIKIWELERQSKEEWESQAKPILELREIIKPEIMDLIKQQRYNHMVEGAIFTKYAKGNQKKDRFWYWRLAPNHKALHYGDCQDNAVLPIEQLPNKISIVDIKMLQSGKEFANPKDKRDRKGISSFAFAIVPDTTDPLQLVASCEKEFDMWTDGIHALLGQEMTSSQTNQDLETLLSMEIKIRLLETEGITIPTEAPPIPPAPANLNFVYHL
ncbi:engulfment and cell motility protein 1-like [Haliotis cracherodii]|uniref:engulfment and cell motility protein 1-like n=1 Tax=Haliotis cracherodii TaxID=6455 RepID=UPI0039EA6779